MKKLKLKRVAVLLLIVIIALSATTSCAKQSDQAFSPNGTSSKSNTPEDFLKYLNLKVKDAPAKFKVTVPADWKVMLGEYPEGLYWELANVYSKDAGLDLTPLKGKNLVAWRYELADGLPGQGTQSSYSYPSNIILLIDDEHVVGAWLAFNRWGIGPSVKQNYLEDLTGLTFDKWLSQQDILVNTEANKDLAAMDPVQVLEAFCNAIDEKNSVRANACMSPDYMLDALTVNLQENSLYNKGYSSDNSYQQNLLEAKVLSYKLMDADTLKEIPSLGDRTKVIIDSNMKMKWKDGAFNSPDGTQTRFVSLKKYENGWKIQGLATGP